MPDGCREEVPSVQTWAVRSVYIVDNTIVDTVRIDSFHYQRGYSPIKVIDGFTVGRRRFCGGKRNDCFYLSLSISSAFAVLRGRYDTIVFSTRHLDGFDPEVEFDSQRA